VSKRTAVLAVVLAVALFAVAWQAAWVDPLRPLRRNDTGQTVVLVVLDNVRGDRLSGCGHARPTTPVLDALPGTLHCNTIAPGSWTLPSHASLFTGQTVPEHGAHSLSVGGEALGLNTSETVRPLGQDTTTLAEHYGAMGFDTVSVSGNPVVSDASGLTRGFDHARAPGRFGSWYGDDLKAQLQHALGWHSHADTDLFLFVNIADAHTPWLPVPDGLDWVPARPGLDWGDSDFWIRFFTGQVDDPSATLAHLTDVYDYGVHRADDTLGQTLALLDRYGRTPDTLVITSDHGEFLGEQGLLDHGHYLYEPNNRVFLYANSEQSWPPVISGLQAWSLLTDAPAPADVLSAAYPHPQRMEWTQGQAFNETSAAMWAQDGHKQLWRDVDGVWQVDLGVADESELVSVMEPWPELGAFIGQVQASGESSGEMDPALREQLIQAGYLEE
jgi:arylsulfatase A-like enzyme